MKEFEITKRSKYISRKIRQKKEMKWFVFKLGIILSALICLLSFVIGIFLVSNTNYAILDYFAIIFSISLVVCVILKAILNNLTSHWIQDRLNERIWINDGILYHFVQTSFAAGLNTRHADCTARIYEYDLSTIKNAKYDSESGRIEFNIDGKLIFYKNYNQRLIGYERQLKGKPVVFYEYMKPSIYKYLKIEGIKFTLETLDFKIRDYHV